MFAKLLNHNGTDKNEEIERKRENENTLFVRVYEECLENNCELLEVPLPMWQSVAKIVNTANIALNW